MSEELTNNTTYYSNSIETEILMKFKEIAKRDDRTIKYLLNKLIKKYVQENY